MALNSSGVCPKLSARLAISNSKLSFILYVTKSSCNSALPLSFKSLINVSASCIAKKELSSKLPSWYLAFLPVYLWVKKSLTLSIENSVLPILATKSAISLAEYSLFLNSGKEILLLNLGIAWILANRSSFCPLLMLVMLLVPVKTSAACSKAGEIILSGFIFLEARIDFKNLGVVFKFCLPAVKEGSLLFSDCLNTACAILSVIELKSFLVSSFFASGILKVLFLFWSTKFFLPLSLSLLLLTAISLAVTVVAIGSNKDCPISNAAELLTLPCR